MHAFDMKINNENLVKCLQTLRHFYSDLHAEVCIDAVKVKCIIIIICGIV